MSGTHPPPRLPGVIRVKAHRRAGLSFKIMPKKKVSVTFAVGRGGTTCDPDLGAVHLVRTHGRSLRAASSAYPHHAYHSTSCTMPNRSEYQPISQFVDDDEADVTEPVASSSASRPLNPPTPKKIDLRNLDNAFKRYVSRTVFHGRFRRWVADGPSLFLKR